ncbi:MAG: outer membrane lipoprotein chaperone LolA [Buchnera aphidicola (Melaphis rhois)]
MHIIIKTLIKCLFFFNLIQIHDLSAQNITFKNRIAKIHDFYSNFRQQIIDKSGEIIQSGIGEIKIKKVGLFNWHLMYPNEIKIISNSKTIWFHDYLTNQVNIFFSKDIVKDTPCILFTNKNSKLFKKYDIFKKQDYFLLFPKDNTTVKYYSICINSNGIIKKIELVEKSGFKNIVYFFGQKLQKFNYDQFIFTSSPGLTIDDKRY